MRGALLGLVGEATDRSSAIPVLAKGFRPFFLLAALFAALSLAVWLAALDGRVRPGGSAGTMAWHAHEMVFGFATAVISGFLLTAVERWTGRATARGGWLAALVALWLSGRVFMLWPDLLPSRWADVVELSFLPAVALAIGRPIVATRSRRNYGFPFLLLLLFGIDLLGHRGLHGSGEWIRRSTWVGVDIVIVMILVITARVVPMFTANATGQRTLHRHPRLDAAAIAGMVLIVGMDIVEQGGWPLAIAAALTSALSLARTAHWGTMASLRHPLLWILHLGHLWVPIGLGLLAASTMEVVPRIFAVHALTVGAIGSLTLGMMTRVTLGHTGRPLNVGSPMVLAFAAILLAAGARVIVPLIDVELYQASLFISGTLFALAFATYLLVYSPTLISRRPDGRPG